MYNQNISTEKSSKENIQDEKVISNEKILKPGKDKRRENIIETWESSNLKTDPKLEVKISEPIKFPNKNDSKEPDKKPDLEKVSRKTSILLDVKKIILFSQIPGMTVYRFIKEDDSDMKINSPDLIVILPAPFTDSEIDNIKRKYIPELSTIQVFCGLCDQPFTQAAKQIDKFLEEKVLEMKKKEKIKKYSCGLCKKEDSMRVFIKQHIFDHILNKDIFCPNCEVKVCNLKEKRRKIGVEFVQLLKVGNSSRYSIVEKIFKFITTEEKFGYIQCNKCNSLICDSYTLIQKLLTSQNIDLNLRNFSYKCVICNETIKDNTLKIFSRNVKNHFKEHINSKCIYCSRCYRKHSDNLGSILIKEKQTKDITTHSMYQSIQCRKCEKTYLNRELFLGNWEAEIENFEGDKLEKEFKCKICQTKFKTKDDTLKKHILEHITDKKILCGECRKNLKSM